MLRKGFSVLSSFTRSASLVSKPQDLKLLSRAASTYFSTNKESVAKKTNEKEAAPAPTPTDFHEKAEELNRASQGMVGLGMAKMLVEREAQIRAISENNTIPDGALVAGALLTAPLLLGSLSIGYFAYANMLLPKLPIYFISLLKYSGLHLAFMSGIHWGFAISEHDCQLDFERSSPFIRKYFVAATIPLALSFMLTGNLVYGFALSSVNYKIGSLMAMLGTHLMVFLGDCYMFKKKRVPQWYLKLKLMITIAAFVSLTTMAAVVATWESKLKVENDPIRKTNIPSEADILSGNVSPNK